VFNQIINVLKNLIMNLENLNLVELNAQESRKIEGGWSFFRFVLTGVLDGIPNNTESHFELFGISLW
jgi:hypothetical protein